VSRSSDAAIRPAASRTGDDHAPQTPSPSCQTPKNTPFGFVWSLLCALPVFFPCSIRPSSSDSRPFPVSFRVGWHHHVSRRRRRHGLPAPRRPDGTTSILEALPDALADRLPAAPSARSAPVACMDISIPQMSHQNPRFLKSTKNASAKPSPEHPTGTGTGSVAKRRCLSPFPSPATQGK
jgi:hypothetical protein